MADNKISFDTSRQIWQTPEGSITAEAMQTHMDAQRRAHMDAQRRAHTAPSAMPPIIDMAAIQADPWNSRNILRALSQGTVIRWLDDTGSYTYAAVKVGDVWYTTATEHNTLVDQVMREAELASLLSMTQFSIAMTWEPTNEPPF